MLNRHALLSPLRRADDLLNAQVCHVKNNNPLGLEYLPFEDLIKTRIRWSPIISSFDQFPYSKIQSLEKWRQDNYHHQDSEQSHRPDFHHPTLQATLSQPSTFAVDSAMLV